MWLGSLARDLLVRSETEVWYRGVGCVPLSLDGATAKGVLVGARETKLGL